MFSCVCRRTSPLGRSTKPNSQNRGGGRGRQGGGRKFSTLDPQMFIKKAVASKEVKYEASRTFEDMPISRSLLTSLTKKGFSHPTEIQDKTYETLMEGHDLMGLAQTGTGKTGAFLIPIIEKLLQNNQRSYALVVVPTRELALQVEEEFRDMTQTCNLTTASFIGGTSVNMDEKKLRKPLNVIIGTPGRLLDLHSRGKLNLRYVNTLVLDEFDRMLDMGFAKDVQRIINELRSRKQTMLFSATLLGSQQKMIDEILRNPVEVRVSSGETSGDQIEQDIVRLNPGEDKFKKLVDMLNSEEFSRVILFDETKHKVNRLCGKLNKVGIKADQIQGNKSQNARQRALNSFKKGQIQVLVATDVAARGIDVEDVSHVINYERPVTFESYIHRIGRTGRAGNLGKAFTFVD